MELKIFKTLWGHLGGLDKAIAACHEHGFEGIEGPAPAHPEKRREFRNQFSDSGLEFIAEICTAGNYVPDRQASPQVHLESLRRHAEAALECEPLFITVIAGCDAWPAAQSIDFFGQAIGLADELGMPMSFETHRSRSFFNPWTTQEILRQLPGLKLTCDFSHWCAVCERLIDTEPEIISLCARHAHHIHARVGYDQGPQVPHPAAPEFRAALEAHERWWAQIWQQQSARGMAASTMTPEFGPDGYLQCEPFTRKPVADLGEINRWMAKRERERFNNWAREMNHLAFNA
jgi:sugar phosphate isomerase/epimerase